MLKKLAVLLAAVAVSAPAFADRGYRDQRFQYQPRHMVVQRPAVIHQYYPRPAPRPVYVVQRPSYNGVALLAGAIIGAAIVQQATTASYGY